MLESADTAFGRGDVNAAVQLLEREIGETDGDRAKAKLAGEMSILFRDRLKDEKRAEEAAKRAIAFDPTNLQGLMVLGEIAFEAKRFLEAANHLGLIAERAGSLDRVFWTSWVDDGYNDWTTNHDNPSPNAYLAYRTTLALLAAATGVTSDPAPASWTVQVFRFDAQGDWLPVLP